MAIRSLIGGGGGPITPLSVLVVAASATLRIGSTVQLALIEIQSDGSQIDRTGAAAWGTSDAAVATVTSGPVVLVGTPSASSECFGTTAALAIDGMVSTYWHSCTGIPQWLQYDHGVSYYFTSYKIRVRDPDVLQGPKAWVVYGSDTGVFGGEETVVDTRSGITGWMNGEEREFSATTWPGFRYYRMVMSETNYPAPFYISIVELTFMQVVVTAVAQGSAIITGTYGAFSDTATITVSAVTPVAVLVVAVSGMLRVGSTLQLSLIEIYSDGSQIDRTGAAVWATTDGAVATVVAGLVTAVAAGAATITGTYDGRSDTASITVSAMLDLDAWVGPAGAGSAAYAPRTSFNLNDADNSLSLKLGIPKDGSITKVGVYCVSITGNPPAYNIGLVTVGADGNPTTSAYGGSSIDAVDFTGAGWVWVTLATPAAAVAGQKAVVRVWPVGGSPPNGTNLANMAYQVSDGWGYPDGFPAGAYFTTGWLETAGWVFFALEYSDGSVYGFPVIDTTNGPQFGPTSTPDEMGMLFQVPIDMVCNGLRVSLASTVADQPFTFRLYDTDGSTVIASVTVDDEDEVGGVGTIDLNWDAVTLRAGQSYRVTALPGGVGNTWRLAQLQLESANSRRAFLEGLNWQKTSRTDAGAWTQDNTILFWMAIRISKVG